MIASENDCDVAVIGGGPSGVTAATLVAQQGYRVSLFERDHFPRFHIGESLIPYCYETISRLGMLDKLKGSHFTRKYGVQFINEHGKLSEPFRFSDYDPHERSQTWQVLRSEFDCMMLDNARAHGVRVHEGARVLDVEQDQGKVVGLRVKCEGDADARSIRSKIVVDASGQSSLLIDRMNLREWDPDLKKAAIWSYFRGAKREPGLDEGGTIVIQTQGKKGWFWYIPLHDDIVSVGVVADYDYLFKQRDTKDPKAIFYEEVERCPGVQPRIQGSEVVDEFRVLKEYSYKARKAAGDGWVLVGDAFGFLDPLYSSGVLLALVSGEMAADCMVDALAHNDCTESRLRAWEPDFRKAMQRMRNLVQAFYGGLNFGNLVRKHPDKKHLITDILIGNLFKDEVDELWPIIDAMREEELVCQS